jgi:hypothetical protein
MYKGAHTYVDDIIICRGGVSENIYRHMVQAANFEGHILHTHPVQSNSCAIEFLCTTANLMTC